MDPNFIKLYKMAQLTIEYLLVCLRNCFSINSLDYCLALSRSNYKSISWLRTNQRQKSFCKLFIFIYPIFKDSILIGSRGSSSADRKTKEWFKYNEKRIEKTKKTDWNPTKNVNGTSINSSYRIFFLSQLESLSVLVVSCLFAFISERWLFTSTYSSSSSGIRSRSKTGTWCWYWKRKSTSEKWIT